MQPPWSKDIPHAAPFVDLSPECRHRGRRPRAGAGHAADGPGPASAPANAPAPSDQQTADPPARAGALSQINGTVSFHTQDENQWSPATLNYPVASGDSFWTEPNASARIVISSSLIAMAGGTEFDVGVLDDNGLQATLPQGEIYLHLLNLAQNETWSVQTPRGLVTFSGAGRYGVVAGDTQTPTTITVLEGGARVTGTGLSLQVAQGQTATINGGDTFQGTVGAAQVDAFLTAMQRADQPPPAAASVPPVVAQMPGGNDLSAYGSWSNSSDNGQVWYPQVAAGWAPYTNGNWAYVAPWGWTWVDAAPWGFAPFHYGRWFQAGGRWGWTPGVVAYNGPPVYAPALVAFIGIGAGIGIGAALASGSVGWIPLGPREPFHPWYHTSDNYLRSVNRRDVTNITVINNRNVTINNFANRGAVTVVPAAAMAESRPVHQFAQHVDPQTLATARPVIGTQPIRPTAATVGITAGEAQRLHLAPAPAGVPVTAHVAPGPAIHAGPVAHGVAARPVLLTPAQEHPGAPPAEHAAERPVVAPEHVEPGVRPPGEAPNGAAPALRTPAEREAGPPPIEHAPAGTPEERHEVTPAQEVRPGTPEHPGETAPRPSGEAPIEHPGVAAPHEETVPATHPPVQEEHVAPRPEEHAPAVQEQHPAPRPEEHPAPRPEEHPAPRPQEHPAPRPEEHPAPRPESHPAPAPHPAPAAHPAPASHPAPAQHEEEKKK